jgi:hypothetical protein
MPLVRRHALKGGLAALAIAAGPSSFASAEDYPYAGLFIADLQLQGRVDLDALCALSFFDQHSDGSWIAYTVDLKAFEQTKAITYIPYMNGTCTFFAGSKTEVCTTLASDAYPESAGQKIYSVISQISDTEVRMQSYAETQKSMLQVILEGRLADEGYPTVFLRCPYPAETLLSHVAAGSAKLPADTVTEMTAPAADLLSSPLVTDLVATLRQK